MITAAVAATLEEASRHPAELNLQVRLLARAEIGVMLVSERRMRKLNYRFRGVDRSTNVLSFAMADGPEPRLGSMLGDLVLAHETVVAEVIEYGIPFNEHLTHLVVHGVLHLVGYDHELSPAAQRLQEEREVAILARLGIGNPYN